MREHSFKRIKWVASTGVVALPPRFAQWPEVPSECVNVLCEGPSIRDLKPEHLLPGPVVAVNHALSLSGLVPVNVWATIDDPKLLWAWAQPHLHGKAKIFSTENNIKFWYDLLGEDGFNERLYCWVPTYMEHLATPEIKAPVIPTVTTTLAWIGNMPAVKRVRLFGCDMVGSNSPLSEEAFSEEEDIGWEFRWDTERTLLALMTKKYRERGKRIERWVKAPHVSRNLLSSWSKTKQLERSC
jgi:hypothetical protein